MDANLRIIDKNNWKQCAALSIQKEQEGYLPSNAYSIAESKFIDHVQLFGIYNKGDVMVGFVSLVLDEGEIIILRDL